MQSGLINGFIVFLIVTFFVIKDVNSQDYRMIKPYTFMFGLYWNIVDDDGNRTETVTHIRDVWNVSPIPAAINVDYYFKKGWSAEALLSYNQYKENKVINGSKGKSGHFLSFDLNVKYSIGYLLEQQRVDPFLMMGLNYTGREVKPKNMFGSNVGVGFNIMIYEGFGIQWRSTAKIEIVPEFYDVSGGYLHHHFGFIYKMPERARGNNFSKPKFKWIKAKPKYDKGRGVK